MTYEEIRDDVTFLQRQVNKQQQQISDLQKEVRDLQTVVLDQLKQGKFFASYLTAQIYITYEVSRTLVEAGTIQKEDWNERVKTLAQAAAQLSMTDVVEALHRYSITGENDAIKPIFH